VMQFRVGRLTLTRQGKRFMFRYSRNRSRHDGYVIAFPTNSQRYLVRKGIFCLGGVAANALAMVLCLVVLVLILLDGQRPLLFSMDDIPTTFFLDAALLNFFYIVTNLIPFKLQLPTDGKQLIDLLVTWVPGANLPVLRPGLGGLQFHGVRPREWDRATVQRLQVATDDAAANVRGTLLGYYYALDTGQLERAGELLDSALLRLADAQGNDRSAILLEAAYFEGFHRGNPAVARKWLHQVNVAELYEYTFLRGAAAVLLAEGLYTNAEDSAKAALKQTKGSLDHGGVIAEREWLQSIVSICQERIKEEEVERSPES
jgi:hypothetical protein